MKISLRLAEHSEVARYVNISFSLFLRDSVKSAEEKDRAAGGKLHRVEEVFSSVVQEVSFGRHGS